MNFDRFRLKIPGLSAWKFGVRHQMSLNSADQEDAESVGTKGWIKGLSVAEGDRLLHVESLKGCCDEKVG